MPPPCTVFPASSLPIQIQLDANGRRRKPDSQHPPQQTSPHPLLPPPQPQLQPQPAHHQPAPIINLQRDCILRRLTQYECEIEDPRVKASPIVCYPLDRIFRECRDRNGPFLVETTPLECGHVARQI